MLGPKAYEPNRDIYSPNRNIAPISSEINESEKLIVGGCQLSELAKTYGTPLYVFDELSLRTACKTYIDSLNKHYPGDSLPLYASKANSSLAICALIASEGFGLDAVSEGELLTALKGGVKGENIVFHGNNKSHDELNFAYKNNVTIVIDNHHDIELLKIIASEKKPAKLMLRFTPGIECHTHEYIRTGHLDSKFGFDPDDVKSVLEELKTYDWAKLTGLHAHIGSQIFEVQPHIDLAGVMADTLKLAKEIGHSIVDLNLGGGLGIKYVQEDNPPSIEEWVEVVSKAVVKACGERNLDLPRLMCEPGRSLVANSGLTIYQIGAKKVVPGIRTYLSVDGGMSDNPRPITYQSLYSACLVDKPLNLNLEKVTIAGKHCESGDVLLKDFYLPSCESGDFLAVFGTGAYNYSMSSNYNRIPRPATVIVGEGCVELTQRRELPEDLLQLDVLPDRFITKN
ncbi:diaminopimelate decarboxylase [Prochlorococcus marinus]|uniref:Diaminopimelate decarboxylase n=1 Tax=Prochlorococcus marinus XMU1408 TaxID=2213228 RepID=A0A318R286_PROMR|nr:diaminopimelate decarboxylase [Prochlorococcus marinus]MBW3042264.1 diaminopimelate decarboxylase [Prochlorococcus marinus str. XMU1408]PYE01652.1 diaminopimelate decarboxylase [Prochlorococcus marinus XMU1408]